MNANYVISLANLANEDIRNIVNSFNEAVGNLKGKEVELSKNMMETQR
jgi:hypothetical protein